MGGLEKFGATGKGLMYEFFTPSDICKRMWGLAYKYGYKGGKILEPSVGVGEFLKYAPENASITTFEINKYSHKICSILFPAAVNNLASFETLFIKNNKSIKDKVAGLPKFELIIGNPPYGEYKGFYEGMGEGNYTKAANWIDYFIFRGLDLLEKNGLLIFIIGTEVAIGGTPWLQQPMNKCKQEIMDKAELVDAYRLPNGVFERTDVLSDIIVLRKK
jgi:type I restriction-modification system DNA methylase subunit